MRHEKQTLPGVLEVKSMPAISVIIPTWNRATTIVAAVQSALSQTLPPLEVLVCDDGSTDDTEMRIRALGDARVKWISGMRGGRPAIPRNHGIAAAKGDWLAFLDSDDVWLPLKLQRQIETLTATGHLACCTDAWRIVPTRTDRSALLGGQNHVIDFDSLLHDNRIICSSVLAHRSLFTKAKGFPEAANLKAIEDYALWLRFLCLTQFDYIAEPLLEYTDDPAHSVRAQDCNKWAQRTAIMQNLTFWVWRTRLEKADGIVRAARQEFYIAWVRNMEYTLRRRCQSLASRFFKERVS